ncbi:PREDICTED: chymotrypsin-like elastase family member 1 [Priapulus caudatus]|uniref:Chymotrypsin-like elastase family member 1 n=1 Tax=Priapulus caudatus TaxID=37621 RepID=A0ABM1EUA0_PRICU|nr:PREDICTED: chymotrypsin-like elastase family member 1 [Priapulus caudatus]
MLKLVSFVCLLGAVFAVPLNQGESCGVKAIEHIQGNGRVTGGIEARQNSWPWQVSLRYIPNQDSHYCGGTLIRDNWIMTAAHCVAMPGQNNPYNVRVYAGSHRLSIPDKYEQKRRATQIIKHAGFSMLSNDFTDDIALIKVDPPFTLTDQVSLMCLPEQNEPSVAGTMVYISGWGMTRDFNDYPNSPLSDVLKQFYAPIYDWNECKQSSIIHWNGVHENMICVGYTGGVHDSCKGDSGGPVSNDDTGLWTVYGIVSWGTSCGKPYAPTMYTQVSKYVDWIMARVD